MRIKLRLILTAYFVNSGWTLVQSHNSIADQALTNNGDAVGRSQGNVQNLFDFVANNDVRNNQADREIVKQEAVREQQIFNKMKEELQTVQYRNMNRKIGLYRESNVVKREIHEHMPKKCLAVTPLIGCEQIYTQVKESRQPVANFESETLEMKSDICASIIKSSPPDISQDLYAISLHEKGILDELKQTNPLVYADLTRNQSSGADFTNPYTLRDVKVNEAVLQERVFSCIAKNRKTASIVQYFISPEYNVNELRRKGGQELLGRFIFTTSEQKKELVVIALAEEPAHKLVHEPDSIEHLFQDEINDIVDKELEKSRRVLCDMTAFQKKRLCISILSADDKVQSILDKDYTEPRCEHRNVSFEHYSELHYQDDYNQWWEMSDPVEEWMLACKAGRMGNNAPLTYYVSRGFTANKFFTSKETQINGTLMTVLEGIRTKVGVVPEDYMYF